MSENPQLKRDLAKAKSLIQAKRYEDARALLITIDHPTADKWLSRLNTLFEKPPAKAKQTDTTNQVDWFGCWTIVGLLVMCGALFVLVVGESSTIPAIIIAGIVLALLASSRSQKLKRDPAYIKKRMSQAWAAIKARQYDKARNLLQGIQHPTAEKWLIQLDKVAPKPKTKFSTLDYVIIGLIVLVSLCLCSFIFQSQSGSSEPSPAQLTATSVILTNEAIRVEPTRTSIPPTRRPASIPQPSTNNTTHRPENCTEARAMGLTAVQAAQWSHLDRDNDGVACYGD